MTSSSLRVNQQTVGDYNELLSTGINQLQTLFASVLTSDIQTVEPLHYITKRKIRIYALSKMLTNNRASFSYFTTRGGSTSTIHRCVSLVARCP